MSVPTRHHYIPQMILRNFADENGDLHCYSKHTGKVFVSKPTNVFVESNLYTRRYSDEETNYSTEQDLSRSIEGPAAPVVEKIIRSARIQEIPSLTRSEKRKWDEFFCCQLRRLPEARKSLASTELVAEVLSEIERDVRSLTITEQLKFGNPQLQEQLTHNAWTEIVAKREGELVEVLQERGLAIGIIDRSNKSFIMGDSPIVRIAAGGCSHLKNPKVELLFPIAHDVIVTPALSSGEEQLILLSDILQIRKINEAIFRKSRLVASCSRKLVLSLSGLRA